MKKYLFVGFVLCLLVLSGCNAAKTGEGAKKVTTTSSSPQPSPTGKPPTPIPSPCGNGACDEVPVVEVDEVCDPGGKGAKPMICDMDNVCAPGYYLFKVIDCVGCGSYNEYTCKKSGGKPSPTPMSSASISPTGSPLPSPTGKPPTPIPSPCGDGNCDTDEVCDDPTGKGAVICDGSGNIVEVCPTGFYLKSVTCLDECKWLDEYNCRRTGK